MRGRTADKAYSNHAQDNQIDGARTSEGLGSIVAASCSAQRKRQSVLARVHLQSERNASIQDLSFFHPGQVLHTRFPVASGVATYEAFVAPVTPEPLPRPIERNMCDIQLVCSWCGYAVSMD